MQNHELIIIKLAASGLNESSLRLIQNYLSKRKQWEWLKIILRVS